MGVPVTSGGFSPPPQVMANNPAIMMGMSTPNLIPVKAHR